MKRRGNLFNKIFTPANLYIGYMDARKGKRKKYGCLQFEKSLSINLAILYEEIKTGIYTPRPFYEFMVFEPKPRLIQAPSFRDMVIQHAIYRHIYEIFNNGFIDTSYACRKGYGTHQAADYAQQELRKYDGDLYTMHIDIRKYFYSIDRTILKALIKRRIKDKRLINIMMLFAQGNEPEGIPIGNLLSQLYALIYLNPVDHFIKREMKVKSYARYMDDMMLIGLTKQQCDEYKDRVELYLHEELRLALSKASVQKIKKGINFVGFRTWRKRRFIRKFSLYKFRKAIKCCNRKVIESLLAHAKRTSSHRHMMSLTKENCHAIYESL